MEEEETKEMIGEEIRDNQAISFEENNLIDQEVVDHILEEIKELVVMALKAEETIDREDINLQLLNQLVVMGHKRNEHKPDFLPEVAIVVVAVVSYLVAEVI